MVHGHQGRGSSPLGLSEQERTKLRKRLRQCDRHIDRLNRWLSYSVWFPNWVTRNDAIRWRNRWDETRRLTRLRLKGYGV